ncbi:MAG: phosphate acyltransferase, partial [Desulfobacterales bacterium]
AYLRALEAKLGPEREIMRKIIIRAQQDPKRIVLPEGNHPVILRAAHQAAKQKIARPVVLGNADEIRGLAAELQIPLEGIEIVDQIQSKLYESFAPKLFELRNRKGWSLAETRRRLRSRYVTGAMMVREGLVDGQVHGISRTYPDAIRPVLQVIPRRSGICKVSGLYLMIGQDRIRFFADTTVNIRPDSADLAEIAILAAEMARFFDVEPRVAMISFSNFGSVRHLEAQRVGEAVALIRRRRPDIQVDGEMQADTALQDELLATQYPFNRLGGAANVLIFPDLAAGNVAYKLLAQLGGTMAVGPLLMGIGKPFNVLQRGSDMENVVNVIAITVAQAQESQACKSNGLGEQSHG